MGLIPMRLTLIALAVLLAACGGGSGGLGQDAAVATSPALAVDLETGRVEAVRLDEAGLLDQRWRDRYLLFRRFDGATPRWIGVFEVTQAQWRRIAGAASDPELEGTAALHPDDGALPATGVAGDDVRSALAGLRLVAFRLRLPSGAEWEAALAAGGRPYAWGEGEGPLVTRAYAVLLRDGETCALRPVGGLAANANGLFDMHGNAWELVDDGPAGLHARGGAFDCPPSLCRADQAVAVPPGLPHPAIGLRLLLVP